MCKIQYGRFWSCVMLFISIKLVILFSFEYLDVWLKFINIIFTIILSVLYFKLCNSSSAMAFIFCCPVSRPDDHDFFFTIKVCICWCTSLFFSKDLIELSLMLSIGQIVKTKVLVNWKYNKIIIIFYLVH